MVCKLKQTQCGSAGNVQTLSSVALCCVFPLDKQHFAHTWHLFKTITGAVGLEPVGLNLHVWTQHIWRDKKQKCKRSAGPVESSPYVAGAATCMDTRCLWQLFGIQSCIDCNEGSADVRSARLFSAPAKRQS